jgi:hypothetical protein
VVWKVSALGCRVEVYRLRWAGAWECGGVIRVRPRNPPEGWAACEQWTWGTAGTIFQGTPTPSRCMVALVTTGRISNVRNRAGIAAAKREGAPCPHARAFDSGLPESIQDGMNTARSATRPTTKSGPL